jgi:hypothetical protein
MLDFMMAITELLLRATLPEGLASMRLLACLVLLWAGLVGYQALAQHADATDSATEMSHLDHSTLPDAEPSEHGGSQHGEHGSNCWTHATCSPPAIASIQGIEYVDSYQSDVAMLSLIYDSRTFPPSSPPPRA